jgi:hypothetical protein
MHKNLDRLLERGVFYPLRVPRHIRLMNTIFSGKESASEVGASLNERADERATAVGNEVHSLVLSDEDVSTRTDLSPLEPFKEHFDVKIVFSMRRQDLWLESWYFQNIKWQWIPKFSHCTFDEFLAQRDDFHWIHYDQFVRQLEEKFGAENLLLNVFEKDQMPDGPVLSFCRQIGLTDLDGFTDSPHFNSSMSAEMVEFLRHMPLDTFKPPERDLIRRAFERVDQNELGHNGKQSERLMKRDLREAILGEYQDGNRAIAQRFFQRGELFLDPLPDPDAPLAQLELPQNTPAALERFVSPLLKELVASGAIAAKKG